VYLVTIVALYLGYVSVRAQRVYAQQVAYNATMESVKATLIPALVNLAITPVDPMFVTATPSPLPLPSLTPLPAQGAWITPASTPSLHIFRLSWYDPDIGRIYPDAALTNFHDWDYQASVCRSRLSSGDDYRDWYGRALACPNEYPIGTIYRVYLPAELAGDWVCLDRGGAVVGDILDFLLRYPDQVPWGADINATPWLSPVVAEVFYP